MYSHLEGLFLTEALIHVAESRRRPGYRPVRPARPARRFRFRFRFRRSRPPASIPAPAPARATI